MGSRGSIRLCCEGPIIVSSPFASEGLVVIAVLELVDSIAVYQIVPVEDNGIRALFVSGYY